MPARARRLFNLAAVVSVGLLVATGALCGVAAWGPIHLAGKEAVGPIIVREHYFTAEPARIGGFFQWDCDKSRGAAVPWCVALPGCFNVGWGNANGTVWTFDLQIPG